MALCPSMWFTANGPVSGSLEQLIKRVFYCSSAHKRVRKPSKRLIEWSEEYEQIFSTRKKTKRPLQMIGKVKESAWLDPYTCVLS